jgi:phospholipid/cholesterol/gamma-HCH transport system substrate-binding protein
VTPLAWDGSAMESRPYTIAAGIFVVLLLVLLAAAILWFDGRGHLRGTTYDLITNSSVAGLAVGANVTLRGVPIGQVQSIQFDTEDPASIRVRIAVDPRFALRKGSYATLSYQGLSGEAYVELDFPSEAREFLASNVLAPARIPLGPSSWSALPDTGERFLKSFTSTLGRVDSILTPENAQQLSRLLVDFSAAANQISEVARDLRPAAKRSDSVSMNADATLRAAHKTLEDVDSLVVDVRAHIGVLDEVGNTARTTGAAVRGVEEALVGESLPKLDQLLDGLSQNSDMLQELLEELKQRPQSVLFGDQPLPGGPGEAPERHPKGQR